MKRCVFCGTENDDSATVCVRCHNQLPDRPDGEEQRLTGFSGDPAVDGDRRDASGFEPASRMPEDRAVPQEQASVKSVKEEAAEEKPEPRIDQSDEEALQNFAAQSGKTVNHMTDGTSESSDETHESSNQMQPEDGLNQEAARSETTEKSVPEAPTGEPVQNAAVDYRQGAAGAAAASFAQQPEGTTAGRIPPKAAEGGADSFGVGRGQTYGARQQYEARGGRYAAPAREQYGSAGYGYRQAPEAAQGRPDLARMNTAVGSKTILFRSRKMVRGFLFFLMTLFFTAMVAVNFCNLALPGAMDPKVSNAYYNLSNLDSSLEGVLGSSNGFATQLLTELAKQIVSMAVNVNGIIQQLGTSVQLSILLIFAVPNVLFALALWIMLIQTKRDRSKFGLGGYTLARVMMVLKFVVACLVLAVGLIISVYFVVVGASSARFTSSFIQGLIMLIIMIFIAIFTIMYYIQWMYTLKCVKVNVRSGSDIGRVPTYVGILSVILAVFFALMLLPLAPNDYLGLAAGGTKALYFLVSGIWLLKYHRVVRRAAAFRAS